MNEQPESTGYALTCELLENFSDAMAKLSDNWTSWGNPPHPDPADELVDNYPFTKSLDDLSWDVALWRDTYIHNTALDNDGRHIPPFCLICKAQGKD